MISSSDSAAALDSRWAALQKWLRERFERDVDVEGILFLVGVQESGRGFEPDLDKSAKERLVMEGTCCVFETIGLYDRVGVERDGNWIWERRPEFPRSLPVEEQEALLRKAILTYFANLRDLK